MNTRSGVTALPQLEQTILATTRYLQSLEGLQSGDLRSASALPGWSRGHVVTHLARNADALTNLLHGAQTGVEIPMYPSDTARDADIEAGAGRGAADLREDAAASWGRFLQAANELHSGRLSVLVRRMPGSPEFPVSKVGSLRRTEVEIHHADLGVGYSAYDWPSDFTLFLLKRRARELTAAGHDMTWRLTDTGDSIRIGDGPGPEVLGHSAEVAWWSVGRGDGDDLVASTGKLPELGRWT